jgi:hypothetical protein
MSDQPRTWALPDEPGPEVTAVRTCFGTRYVRAGDAWSAVKHHGVFRWDELIRYGPLTDATAEPDLDDPTSRTA